MTTRQKFWLKVLLAVTFPAWCIPAMMAGAVYLVGLCMWEMASDIVDGGDRLGDADYDGP